MVANLNADDLIIFYFVAREKSLSSAAEKLFLTQPAVTYRIKTLEEYTRVKLLDIKKRQVALTPHGQELFKYAEEIYRQLANAGTYLKSAKESYLRAGIASMYVSIVSPVIKKMFEEHPEVKLTVRSGDASSMVQDVLDSYLDLAIVPQFDYEKEKVTSVTVSNPQMIVCFASYNLVITREPLAWKDLPNYPLVSGPEDSVIRRMIFNKLKEKGLEVQTLAAEVNYMEWCKTLVEDGKGLSFTIIEDIKEALARRRLKIVPLEEDLYLTAEAVMRHEMYINPSVREFIALVKRAFGYTDGENPPGMAPLN